jgi:flagellar hook protein FlgE
MSLFGSMSSGVSGLLSQSEAISVISDNLANVNTIGYKNTRTLFDQQVTSSGLSGTLYNAGGVGTSFDRFQNAQGSLLSTQSSTDLALSGNGFFTVVDNTEIDTDTAFFYTRAGAFSEDNRGFLTNASGQHILGWRTESDGTIEDIQNPEPVELQSVSSSARASGELIIGFNLTASEDIHAYDTTQTLAQNLDTIVADPTTADFVTDVRFFDSEGGSRDISLVFSKRANNEWDWSAYTDGSEIVTDINGAAVADGTNATIGRGELFFNRDGGLKFATGTNMSVQWSGGVEEGLVDVNFGDFTGGFLFDETTVAGNVVFADGVTSIGMSEELTNSPLTAGRVVSGTYAFNNLGVVPGGYNVQVTEPDGTTFTSVMPTANIDRTLEFSNGVTFTVGAAFDITTWGGGTIDIPALPENPLDEGRGTDGAVQFSSAYNTRFANQNGFGSGTLAAVSVDDDGFVIGSFTNGESKKLWQLVISVFQDTSELETVGNNLLRETDGSGRPLYKVAGVSGTATIVSGALEQSTVDIAQEFSNMIISQRAFQASSTIISTADQMLNELLQIR